MLPKTFLIGLLALLCSTAAVKARHHRHHSPHRPGMRPGNHLAGVRDKEALARLPDHERASWRRLWADVAALLKKVTDKP
jgi:hypothetical protein